MSKRYFEGWYLKHQKNGNTLALIPGRSNDTAFIQVIDNESSQYIPYPLAQYQLLGNGIRIGDNYFSTDGIRMDIVHKGLRLFGTLSYQNAVPVAYDIMGPFRFLPMECRHSVMSMNHRVEGTLLRNGEMLDFEGGKGYIEGDRGRSFPECYSWTHANDFEEDCSIMVSIAKIPFAGFKFWGCISFVWFRGKEYRLATYKGVKIVERSQGRLEIAQGRYRLIVEIPAQNGHVLLAPQKGLMHRTIHEVPACAARYRFYEDGNLLFDKMCKQASYEFVDGN